MGKAKLIMTLVFVVTLGSGLIAGMLVTRLPVLGTPKSVPASPLMDELGLTSEQADKMRDIWQGVRGTVDDCFLRAQEAQKRRDEALLTLLSDEQKAKFGALQQDYAGTLESLKSQRDEAFQSAVARTEQMLSEQQKQRYRDILRSRLARGPDGDVPDWLRPPATSLPVSSR